MKDAGFRDSSAQKQAVGPDGTEQEQDLEYLTVATREKNVRKTTYMLGILFIVGLFCLWFMIKNSEPQATTAAAPNAEETQIETAIARLTGASSEMFSRMDSIVKKFYEFSNVEQIKVNELVKNPFKREEFLDVLKAESGNQQSDRMDEILRQQQLKKQVKNLRLLSIMQSANGNCCMINDKILYEGNSIRDFKVRHVGDDYVELESQSLGGRTILRLAE